MMSEPPSTSALGTTPCPQKKRVGRVASAARHARGMPVFSQELLAVLARQDGVVTRRQLVAGGVSPAAVRWNSGRAWRVLLPHVVMLSREAPRPRQRQVAGLLWAGPHSVLAGATAAAAHGITTADPRDRVHLLVPAPLSSRRSGFADVRRTLLHDPDTVTRGSVRLSSPARAAVDAARAALTERDRSAILIEAVQRGLCSVDDLAEWVHRLRTRDSARLRIPLEHAASGAWSLPESEVLELVARSAVLPPAWANPALEHADGSALTTPDVWFDDVALAVMVHSRQYHAEADAWDATVERDADLVGAGVVVVGVTPRSVRSDPRAVLRRIEGAHEAASARPRPGVVARPRLVDRRARRQSG